jgi:hypothetical protein
LRRPDLHRPFTLAAGALTLAGTVLFAGQTVAQEAAAPRYMNWSGRGPAVMPQGVQTASNETAAPRRSNTPIPHGGFARAGSPVAASAPPARRTLTPASAWITPGASYGMANAAPAPAPYSAPVETREAAAAPTPAPAATPVEARVDLPPPPRAPSYSPNVAPQPQAQFQSQRQDDRQFLPEYLAGQGGAQPAPSQAVYADAPSPAPTPVAPTYAEPQGPAPEVADPMAPRRDAPIFRLQRQAPVAPAPIPGPSAESAPAGPRAEPGAEAAPAPRQMAAVTANPSDRPDLQASRRYSVHRQNGQQPDAVTIPQPTYVDALAVTLTDMPASPDLAEPAPGPNLYRDNQGRVRAAPAASDGDHQ